MAFKKHFVSGNPVIINHEENDKNLFPVGFSYRIGSIVYKVAEVINTEPHASMRRILLSDGATEIMTVESVKKDLKQKDTQIISTGEKPVEENIKKKASVKKSKKKTDKKK